MSNFHVGQKVVCINASCGFAPFLGDAYETGLRKGSIYIIASLHCDNVQLVEFPGLWCRERFRPLVERKTSIEVFKKLLVTSKQPMNVE